MVFFAQYGAFSWVLILLAAGVMTTICAVVMGKIAKCQSRSWCALYEGHGALLKGLGEGCLFLLMAVTGGAMVSAAGELIALLLPIHSAYAIGMGLSLLVAFWVSQRSFRPLAVLSAILSCGILAAYFWILSVEQIPQDIVSMNAPLTVGRGVKAGISALAYGGMNMAVALGVVCECAEEKPRRQCRTAVLFGLILTALLFVSNYLFLRHEELQNVAFPIVPLLAGLGREGFLISVGVLYLAVVTTLIAILCALKNMAVSHLSKPLWRNGLTLLVPLLFALIGFEQIVEKVYAPMGLCCLLLLFGPILVERLKKQ